MKNKKFNELKPEQLASIINLDKYDFKTTSDISVEEKPIGQDRARKAIDFGLNVKSEGFNLFISGIPGTGRNTTILNTIEKVAKSEPVPDDLCYLYSFQKHDEPKALTLPAGIGHRFRDDMDELIEDAEKKIQAAFTSEDYEKHRKEIYDRYEEQKEQLNAELKDYAQSRNIALQQTLTGLIATPILKNHLLTEDEYQQLPDDKKDQVKQDRERVYEKLYEISRKIRDLDRVATTELDELDKKIGLYAIGHVVDDLKRLYKDFKPVLEHLDGVQDDILKNIEIFKKETKAEALAFLAPGPSKESMLDRYRVNLLVDNSKTKGAPVVVEHNPTYHNLIGNIEYKAQLGVLSTDFTLIKSGAVHKANGGYLVIQANQLLQDYFAWDSLKKIIRYKSVKIETLAQRYGVVPTSGMKPQPMPVDLKVILIGNPMLYHLLYIYDEDFMKLFKVKADFDTSFKKSDDMISRYINFIALKAREEKLMAFNKNAVERIINYGTRAISHKERLTARLVDLIDIMREANYWAKKEKAKHVYGEHVQKALEEKVYRSSMIEEKIDELIDEGTIIVDTQGSEVGQINGMAILDMGDYMFGKPSRITAKTYIGKGEIVNIEREAKMSGKIHSKGVMIINGYLGYKFAQDKPLSLSASICFEQLYEEVEGDSASSTELYCLLSSLSGLALRQDIAVTGSVDQKGMIQPVGGVTQKIEGFYKICKLKGLTGKQGVIIPESNTRHLTLMDEVIDAVRTEKFHIYPVKTIDEGIEILTGVEAGVKDKKGHYKKGAVNYLVNEKLNEYAKIAGNSVKKPGKKK